jgi:hypothetical protein
MRRALNSGEEVPAEVREIVDRVRELLNIPEKIPKGEFPKQLLICKINTRTCGISRGKLA